MTYASSGDDRPFPLTNWAWRKPLWVAHWTKVTPAKAQRILSGDQDARVATALSEALQDVMKEMNLRIWK